MLFFIGIILVNLARVFSYEMFPKPVLLERYKCSSDTHTFNDCNWCYCTPTGRFECKTRPCYEVDKFREIKEATKLIDNDVGFGNGGHGAWRSSATPCEPLVVYLHEKMQCHCTEEGTWPSPACSSHFRTLHPVELGKSLRPNQAQPCTPNKLILVSCNYCLCPESGVIDPSLCTKHRCHIRDPVLLGEERLIQTLKVPEPGLIYALCDVNTVYKIGCRTCQCFADNRLVCGECDSREYEGLDGSRQDRSNLDKSRQDKGRLDGSRQDSQESEERGVDIVPIEVKNGGVCPEGQSYQMDCNYCFCLSNGNALCTAIVCSD